jgi:hypothetical protein
VPSVVFQALKNFFSGWLLPISDLNLPFNVLKIIDFVGRESCVVATIHAGPITTFALSTVDEIQLK